MITNKHLKINALEEKFLSNQYLEITEHKSYSIAHSNTYSKKTLTWNCNI